MQNLYLVIMVKNLPYFLVGDEIYLLKTWLMQPYTGNVSLAQKVFNYSFTPSKTHY